MTSSWVRAAGRFGHTPEKPLVMFYVEGDEDVPFWKEIIKPYLAKYDIQVCTNKAVNPDEGNGKTFLLKMSGLGTNKIVAVDADFDLLIDDYSEYTEMVRNHPYVINTTWYSLENILMQKVNSISLLKNFSRVFKGYFVRYLIGVSNKSIKPKGGFGEMLQKLNIQKLALEGDFSGIVNSEEIDVQDSASFQEKFDKMYVTKDIYSIYNWLMEDCGYPKLPELEYEKRKLEYEDVYPMLYLKYRLTGKTVHKNIKHLVIDEMQDYSYLQYVILNQIFQCRMTILGDKAQTLDTKMQDVLTFLPKIFDTHTRKIIMDKSYRNTVEIAEYAGKISGITDLKLLNRHGKEVEEQTFATVDALLDEILVQVNLSEEAYETAAIITMTEEEANDLYRLLKLRGEEVHYINRDSQTFRKGLTVTTFYLAKGLEFDQVFGVFQKEKNPMDTQAKYICATRALHELYMYELS